MPLNRPNGAVIGIVSSLDDPEGLGRVRVTYPHLDGEESNWARLVSLMAGHERGAFFRPEVDDEVMILFEQGDGRRPYVVGGVWNAPDPPPPDDGKPTENNHRLFKSRSGHILRFDDTAGAEKIEIIDKDGARKVILDSAGQKIQVICDTGDVEVSAGSGSVTVKAQDITLEATSSLTLKATGNVTIEGAQVAIN